MQHLAFDDRRRLLRPSVIPDDAISVFDVLRSPLGSPASFSSFIPFAILRVETSLEFNNLAGTREKKELPFSSSSRITLKINNIHAVYSSLSLSLSLFLISLSSTRI